MPTLTVRTTPVKGLARIYRASGRYGIMAQGRSPVRYTREYPWDFVAAALPVVISGRLWVAMDDQVRGICDRNRTVTLRYTNMGPAEAYL